MERRRLNTPDADEFASRAGRGGARRRPPSPDGRGVLAYSARRCARLLPRPWRSTMAGRFSSSQSLSIGLSSSLDDVFERAAGLGGMASGSAASWLKAEAAAPARGGADQAVVVAGRWRHVRGFRGRAHGLGLVGGLGLRFGRRREIGGGGVTIVDVEVADAFRHGFGLLFDALGQIENLVVLQRRAQSSDPASGAASTTARSRGVVGALGPRRRVVLGDDPPDGGENLLHRRFLVGIGHGRPIWQKVGGRWSAVLA